jgi:hypothetical protein
MSSTGAEEASEEGGHGAGPPISPEQFVNDLDALASYIIGRGLPLLMIGHYRWMIRYLASYFQQNSEFASLAVHIPFPSLITATVSFESGRRRLVQPAIILAAWQVANRLLQLIVSLVGRLLVSAVQSARAYARASALASPPLIAAIVIVFFSGDSWKILGQGFDWQFGALAGFFLLLSLAGVSDLASLSSRSTVSREDLDAMAADDPAARLASALAEVGYEIDGLVPLSWPGRVNALIVYALIITANFAVVGGLVSGALFLVGVIRINAALTHRLSGEPAHVLLHLPANMVITAALVSLSLTLGGLAVLSFAFVSLPNRRARVRFASTATAGLRRVLIAYAIYHAALDNTAKLTGIVT